MNIIYVTYPTVSITEENINSIPDNSHSGNEIAIAIIEDTSHNDENVSSTEEDHGKTNQTDSVPDDSQSEGEVSFDMFEIAENAPGDGNGVSTQYPDTKSRGQSNKCTVCKKVYSKAYSMKVHMRTHTGERPYHCSMCSATFTGQTALQRHTQRHNGVKAYECDTCDKSFVLKVSLQEHQKTVHGSLDKLKTLHCDFCEKSFRFPFQLRNHRRLHTGERPNECEICGLKFRSNNRLITHKKRVHWKIRKFMCDYCEKTFKDSGEKKTHEMIHTGERPFPCEQCDKAFRWKNHLKRHVTRWHSSGDNFICNKCTKKFNSKSELKEHQSSAHDTKNQPCQTGKSAIGTKNNNACKSFVCKFCNRAFALQFSLNMHVKVVHGKTSDS